MTPAKKATMRLNDVMNSTDNGEARLLAGIMADYIKESEGQKKPPKAPVGFYQGKKINVKEE